MANNNKSYRIRTKIGQEADTFLDVHLDQDYDSLEILSLKISDKDVYRLHNSDYGVVVGRVLANGNFGVPNAKISVFISADTQNSDMEILSLYPYTSTSTRNEDDIRYNLLPDKSVRDCHKAVGTFPHKTYLLDNDALLEIFDKYYVYTTRTNAAGDYLICGVPTGMQTIHMDLDLSDCGILSQRPRDFVYKGYTIEQFENPNQFKKDENLDSLAQVFTQNQPVYVQPFWGNVDNGENIGITRADIEITFKFEPTCVFMGSAVSDNASNGISKKCVPTNTMGLMEELTAGEGTIEMIRKTPAGNVEEFTIKGNELINGNGVWCYQIPMNLDYMMTDEYGNMVPTDDPEKGIPTRTRVRFRASLSDMEENTQSFYRAKYLIPNNPSVDERTVDYNFGTYTEERSYRDLFWNGVYTVKSYIPRFQKSKAWRNERFSGIKACNYYGNNNPMPYNNMRIKLPFMFTVLCIFVKLFLRIVSLINRIITGVLNLVSAVIGFFTTILKTLLTTNILAHLLSYMIKGKSLYETIDEEATYGIAKKVSEWGIHCVFIGDGLCPEMEGWYFAPSCGKGVNTNFKGIGDTLMRNTMAAAASDGDDLEAENEVKDTMKSTDFVDETSIDNQNTTDTESESICLTNNIDYLLNCFEMNLAQEYRVIKFDFYNDWVNGVIYFPRWMRKVKRKKKYKYIKNGPGLSFGKRVAYYKDKVLGCMNSENSRVNKSRYYTQQCSLTYREVNNAPWSEVTTLPACWETEKMRKNREEGKINQKIIPSKCHKKQGMNQSPIFGKKSGLVTEQTTMLGQYVYYLKPCEWTNDDNGTVRTLLFATDIVLLGTLNDCDENGIPQAFKYLNSSSYIMPTNLALTTMDDDAYIYAGKDGTICAGNESKVGQKNSLDNVEDSAMRLRVDYITSYCAYTQSESDSFQFENNDDPIPVTEAAGITWNYAGPGQEDIEKTVSAETPSDYLNRLFGTKKGTTTEPKKTIQDLLYYPGGHFLGLSCVNSDSNIKSCVNLKRICEAGATMSQRREVVASLNNENGKPQYKYYVPTGLISDVDIEGAAFRTMFATLNHNKLIATERNETTGYKKYNFRFLRPDGFDGALKERVHQKDSPYNQPVSGYVQDNRDMFQKLFPGLWTTPDDYDEKEVKNTERRTVEDGVNDYFMFRMGLNDFSSTEQMKHFLKKGYSQGIAGYTLPQYENSFYFYFGLKDGSTALDEFRKQFFSECEPNNVMQTPDITVIENIDKTSLGGTATIVIDNMQPGYEVTVTDNITGESCSFPTEDDEFELPDTGICEDVKINIGHKYTITVTDSIEQTVTKTFVFGASAVKVNYQTVNFRRENLSTNIASTIAREGGYIKINDEVEILKEKKHISVAEDDISFVFKWIDESDNGKESAVTVNSGTSYVDMDGQTWYLYFPQKVGTYNVYLKYGETKVSVFTVTLEDNSKVNLYYSCDYLSYKPTFIEMNGTTPKYSPCYPLTDSSDIKPKVHGLRQITASEWQTNAAEIFSGKDWNRWLMRHSFYRQTGNANLGYNNYIYTKNSNDIAIFGHPESGNVLTQSGGVMDAFAKPNKYRGDFEDYVGYTIDDSYAYFPTAYCDTGGNETSATDKRRVFDAMAYSDDGRAAANVLSGIVITDYSYDNDNKIVALTYTGSGNDGGVQLEKNHGAIAVFENGAKLFCVVTSTGTPGTMSGHSDYNIYPNTGSSESEFKAILAMTSVYPTLQIPIVYKPFHVDVSAATWNMQELNLAASDAGETLVRKVELPLSYKVEGDIYNGLTFKNDNRPCASFYSRQNPNENFETYLNFKDEGKFWEGLRPTESGHVSPNQLKPSDDYKPKREINFGYNIGDNHKWPDNFDQSRESISTWPSYNIDWSFGREIIENSGNNVKDADKIEYAIKEEVPTNPLSQVYTGRYTNKQIDQAVTKDSCSMDVFFDTPSIKVVDAKRGLNGPWYVYIDSTPPPMVTSTTMTDKEGLVELRATKVPLFDTGPGPLCAVTEDRAKTVAFFHGVYNGNAKNDIPGTNVIVTVDTMLNGRTINESRQRYVYSVTQDNGSKVQKSIRVLEPIDATEPSTGKWYKASETDSANYFPEGLIAKEKNQLTSGEILLRMSGITLSHQYSLRGPYKRDISKIEAAFNGNESKLISGVSTPNTTGQLVSVNSTKFYSEYQTLIARYIKPVAGDKSSMNRMVLYRLWPIEDLKIIYPASPGGIEPYLLAIDMSTYNKDAQDVAITVATSVPFGAIAFEGERVDDTGYTPDTGMTPDTGDTADTPYHIEILKKDGKPVLAKWITFKDGENPNGKEGSRNIDLGADYRVDGELIQSGMPFQRLYKGTVNSITIHLKKYAKTLLDDGERYAVIYLECTDKTVPLYNPKDNNTGVGAFKDEWVLNKDLVCQIGITQLEGEIPEPPVPDYNDGYYDNEIDLNG